MTSTRITPTRVGLAAGAAMLTTLAIGAPAFATDEFPPKATVTATSGCENGVFFLHTTMDNTGGLGSAHFVVTATDVKGPITVNQGVDVAAFEARTDDWQFFEDVPGSVHITSDDNSPAVDYSFAITPDCVPAEVIPEIPTPTVPEVDVDDEVEVLVPTALPVTGSSSPITAALAFGLVGVGILLKRSARRA